MELGCLPAAERKRRRHLSRLDVRRLQNDHRAVAQRVGDCLVARGTGRCPAHRTEQGAGRLRHRLCRDVSQRAAARAVVHLVLRAARAAAGQYRRCLQAVESGDAAIPRLDDLPGFVYQRPGCRAGAGRHLFAAQRPEERRSGARLHVAADLPLRDAADGLPSGRAAADFRVPQHLQELRRLLHHRSP